MPADHRNNPAAPGKGVPSRLVQFRQERRIGRAALARSIDVTPEALATWENGTVRLPWQPAESLWRVLSLNSAWLATGEGLQLLTFEPFRGRLPRFERGARFEDVWPQLAPVFSAVDSAMRPIYLAQVEVFLSQAKDGHVPTGLLSIVAHTIDEHRPATPVIKIRPAPALES